MNLNDLHNYGSFNFDEVTWRYEAPNTSSSRNESHLVSFAKAISQLTPLSSKINTMTVGQYGSRVLANRISLDLQNDEDHFWFRAVYQLINPKHVGYQNLANIARWRSDYVKNMEEQLAQNSVGYGLLGNFSSAQNGYVFLILEGGGPIDNSAIDVEVLENFQDIVEENFNQNLFTRGVHHYCYSKAMHLYVDPPASGEPIYNGRISIEPCGTKGLLQARVVTSSSRKGKHLPDSVFDNSELLASIKELRSQKYQPYSGWIPSDTSDFEVDAGSFIMKQLAGEPSPLFGSDFLSRYRDRRIHMTGAVSLLFEGKKYNVPAGLYFVYPYDTNLEDITMLQYDYWLTDLANHVTMLTNSSRSQSLTNRLRDQGGTPIFTAITSRPLSVKESGDSGFIPRPIKRRIN